MLDIFTGIEVMLFWLGVVCLAVIQGLAYLKVRYQTSWQVLLILLTGIGTMIFGVAWVISSIIEKEPQSASMSLMVIFFPGLLIATMGGRMAWQKIVSS